MPRAFTHVPALRYVTTDKAPSHRALIEVFAEAEVLSPDLDLAPARTSR